MDTIVVTQHELDETSAFLERVLLDGRYVRDVRARPEEVARALGWSISGDAVRDIETRSFDELLDRIYDVRITNRTDPVHPYIPGCNTMGEFVDICIITLAIGGIAIVVLKDRPPAPPPLSRAATPTPTPTPPAGDGNGHQFGIVTDFSPNAAAKL
jgi:hypothetical protein